ncbi:MAG: thioredoxin [Firmicutes bacterium]|nr:thioredoxin [Bacillota bacterium]
MEGKIVTLTDANFETEIKKATLPVLVDFWASWCGPCQMLAPVLEELADEFSGRLMLGKLDVDENRRTAASFGVMSIPTLILFRNGSEVTRITGFRPKEELSRLISQALA